jgi:hypothetical protein
VKDGQFKYLIIMGRGTMPVVLESTYARADSSAILYSSFLPPSGIPVSAIYFMSLHVAVEQAVRKTGSVSCNVFAQ